jgi:lysylphosphatidylglycerol synthetase-like protein (DUF2156 family)
MPWASTPKNFNRRCLGMAPMTGFREGEEGTPEERAIHCLFKHSFRGLHHYKAKFATSWEPRYLVYGNVLELPRAAFAVLHLSEIKEGQDQCAASEEEPACRR